MGKEYGFKIISGAIKCKVCNRQLKAGHHKSNCCKSAYKQYLKSINQFNGSKGQQ